jgi:uncharacterized protein
MHPLLAVLTAFVIATVMSTGGLSGAFLLLPFQISVLGLGGPVVTSTNHLFNVLAIPAGVYRYHREGRMLWPLAIIIAVGTLPGVIIGGLIRIYFLSDNRSFKLFVGGVLIFIGTRLVRKVLGPRAAPATEAAGSPVVQTLRFDWQRFEYSFRGEVHGLSAPQLVLLTVVVGVIGGAYGVGGGAIIAPILVSAWKLPIHTTAGATLCGTFLTSAMGLVFFWLMGAFFGVPGASPNWALGVCFGVGGLIGTYAGARLQRFVPARIIEAILVVVVTGLGLSYVAGFFAG